MSQNKPIDTLPNAGLLRRLAATLYDLLLLLAILIIAGFIALPFNGGEAPKPGNLWYQTYLFLICYVFFAWFWTHGGQTLGMRAWRLRVQNDDGSAISWPQSLLRFIGGLLSCLLLGVGLLWICVDRDKLALHDRFSHSRIVLLPKKLRNR